MIAYKLTIGSDDDEITAEQVRQLPQIHIHPASLIKAQPKTMEYDYYADLHKDFDIYFHPTEEIVYLTEKGN